MSASQAATRMLGLDALRGALALIVVLHHVKTLFASIGPGLARHSTLAADVLDFVSRRNVEAVIGFFVLSGLSIRLSVEKRGLNEPGSLKVYLYRRARRIVPLYLLSLALAAFVALTVAPVPAEAISLLTLVGNLCFLQTAVGVPGLWFLPYAGNGPLWSLSFEAFFYLGYPVLVRSVMRRPQRMAVVLGITALGLGVGAVVPNPFAMFCAASLMWYLGVELAERHLGARPSLPWPAFVALWLLLTALRVTASGLTFHGLWVATSLFLVAVTLLTRLPSGFGSYASMRRLVLVPLSRVGALSYGLYVLHVPILRAFVAVFGGGFVSALSGVVTCMCVAWLAERAAARVPLTSSPTSSRPLSAVKPN